jgi:hypothetical protein
MFLVVLLQRNMIQRVSYTYRRRWYLLQALIYGLVVLTSCGTLSQHTQPSPAPLATPIATHFPSPEFRRPPTTWEMRWLRGVPCRLPCWEGVTIGQTPVREAAATLSQSPALDKIQLHLDMGYITWNWRGGEEGGEASFESVNITGTIDFLRLYYYGSFRLGDIIETYGPPSHVQAFGSDQTAFLRLIFAKQQFSIIALHTGQTPVLNTDLLFSGPDVIDHSDLVAQPDVRPWEGFKNFDYYCRSSGTDQSCQIYKDINETRLIVATALADGYASHPIHIAEEEQLLEVGGFYQYFPYTHLISEFHLCGSQEVLWVERHDELASRFYDVSRFGQAVYVRMKGTISIAGQYGQAGKYDREFRVQEILDIHMPRQGDCS